MMKNDVNAAIISKALHKKHGKISINGDFDRKNHYFAQYKVNDTFYYITNVMPYTIHSLPDKPTTYMFILPKDLVDNWKDAPKEYRVLVIDWDRVYDLSMDYVYEHLNTKFPSFYKKNIIYKSETNNSVFFTEDNEIKYKSTEEDTYLTNYLLTFAPKPCQYSKHIEQEEVTILGEQFKSLSQFCELYGINKNSQNLKRLKVRKPDYSTWTFQEILDLALPLR